MSASWAGRAWSCTVRVVVDDADALAGAVETLTALLDRVDHAASRFRPDSDLSRANEHAGRPTPVSPLLLDLVDAALTAAHATGGAVDPTLGRAMNAIGYDRDIDDLIRDDDARNGAAALVRDGQEPSDLPAPAESWREVRVDRDRTLLTVPAGCALDLGATAKARTADLAARTIAERFATSVLVELGGDVAVAGGRNGGWTVRVAEREGADGQVVALTRGGLTTSTTTARTWRLGNETQHHILDPRTQRPADGPWRSASVHAASACDANVASTAAIVLGEGAVQWLAMRGIAARLVGRDGAVVTTPGWPGHLRQPAPTRTRRWAGCAAPYRGAHVITVHRRAAS